MSKVAVVTTGLTPTEHLQDSEGASGLPFVTPSDFSHKDLIRSSARVVDDEGIKNVGKRVIPKYSTCVTCIGSTIGKTGFSMESVLTNQQINSATAMPTLIDSRYLYYAILSRSKLLKSIAGGSASPIINKSTFGELMIPLVDLISQKAIADVLGALDDKIAANQRVMQLSDELIHAEYRMIEEYVVIPFTELRITNGAPFTGAHFNSHGEGLPLIRIRDLRTNAPQVWTTEQRTDSTEIQPGDLLVGLDAEFRPTTWLGAPGLLNQRMMKVSSEFYGSALLREAIKRPLAEIENYKTGTTVIHLNLMDLKQATVKVPNDSVVATIRSRIDPVYEAMVAKAQENQVLARTRDELLPLLMNGKLSVSEASEAVEGVVGKQKEGDGDV
nr:restriction endonuclease subunit S [Corynebacterium sp. 5QC2CO]